MAKKSLDVGLNDFSQRAIKKAVTMRGLQSPVVLYPSAVGILALAGLTIAGTSALWIGIGVGSLAVGAGVLGWQLGFRREQLARDYLANLHDSLNKRRQAMLRELTDRMHQLDFPQGIRQIEILHKKFTNYVDILDRSLDPEEITYGRYLGIAEQVYLSSLDNLEKVAGALASVRTIDPRHIDARIEDIHADGIVTETESIEKDSLNQRKALYDDQLQKADTLMAQNEQAMTQLDLTGAAIAGMDTKNGQATMDMESAIAELQKLVVNAPLYNKQN